MPTLIALTDHPVLQRDPNSTRIFWVEALEITPETLRYREIGMTTENGFIRPNHRTQ